MENIAALKKLRIVWHNRLDSKDTEVYTLSADGADFKVFGKKHPTLNLDKSYCSKKMNHGALKYEISISMHEPKIV